MVLQLFIGVVDAQLLERVPLEVLEAEDVEDADEGHTRVITHTSYLTHEEVEQRQVQILGQRVSAWEIDQLIFKIL